jgi:hypothetical protein
MKLSHTRLPEHFVIDLRNHDGREFPLERKDLAFDADEMRFLLAERCFTVDISAKADPNEQPTE